MAFRYVLAILLATSALADDVNVDEYTFLTMGEPSGSQVKRVDEDGTVRISYEFNDRGRGPELEFVIRLDEDGYPIEFSSKGVNYRKGDVDETFSIADGVARWQSSNEQGQGDGADGKFYVPYNTAPEIMAMLARALLASEDGTVELLPSGQASIEAVATERVTREDQESEITLYSIQGIDTEPTHVWLDAELDLFGIDLGWFGVTQTGWEHSIDLLKQGQTDATSVFFEDLSDKLSTEVTGLIVVEGGRVFDSVAGTLSEPATVFIWRGVISAVFPEGVEIPDDAIVINASGKTVIPSLWDMHGHVSMGNFTNYLAAGVTNVRDMANNPERIFQLSGQVEAGRIAGPDVHALGFIDKRNEFAAPTGMLADDVDDAISFVDWYAQRGFRGIKLYSSIEPPWVEPVAKRADELGMPVMGHVPVGMNAEQAIAAGYGEITHINMLLLNFLGAEEIDTRTPMRFIVPGEQAGDIDLASAEVQALIDQMKANDIAHDPTLSIFIQMFTGRPGKVSPVFADIIDHLPVNEQRYRVMGKGYNDGKEDQYDRAAEISKQFVALLHENGIRVLPGTDNALPGFTLIRELMYYAEAGIPANEVLQLATIESARHLGLDQRLGSITPGKDAHLVVIDGDPTEDLSDLYRVEHVIKGQKLYYAPDLLEAQGFVPFTGGN